jgi:outer membrane protein TolC
MDVERSRQGLILQVYESFYAALMNEQGVRVNEEGVTIAQKHLELAKARFDAGSAARLDVLRAEVELSNAKAKLIRARSETDVAYQRLRTVLSLPQGEPLQLAGIARRDTKRAVGSRHRDGARVARRHPFTRPAA